MKSKFFTSQAHYYKSLLCETEGKYGRQVAHITLAETLAKDAAKCAKDLAASESSDNDFSEHMMGGWGATAAANGRPAVICTESCKQNLTFLTERKNAAVRDNDIVYHDMVPSAESLEPLDKVSMAKPMKLTEVFPNLKALIGIIIPVIFDLSHAIQLKICTVNIQARTFSND
jgi:hypothetical protein